ncbi:vesicle coat component [Globomyces sp. JEL0801]|nr:vesicle coat component [Globomyces sp. JEL0801]
MSAPPQQQNPGSPIQKTTSPNQKTSPTQLHDQPLILTSAPDFHHTHTQPHIQSERQSANPIFPEQSPLFQHHSNAPNGMVQAHLEHNLPSHNENSNYTQHVNGVGEYGGANQIGQVPNTNEFTQQIQTDNQSIGQELPYGDQHQFVESVNAKVEPHPIGGSVYQYQDHQQGYETQHQYHDQIAYAENYQQPDAGQVYGDYQDQIQGDYQGHGQVYGQEYGQHDYQGPVQGQGDYQEQNPVDYQGQANYQEQNPIDYQGQANYQEQNPIEYQNQTSYQEQNPIDYQNQTSYQEQNPVDYQNQTSYQEQNPVDYQNQTSYQEQNPVDYQNQTSYQEQNQVDYQSQANYQEQGQDNYPDQSQVNYQTQNQVYQEQNPVDYQSQGQTNYQDQNQVQGEYPYQNQFGYQDQNQADYQGQVQDYQYENPAYGDQNQPYEDQTQTNYQEFSNQSQYPDVSQHPYSQPNEWQPQYQQPYPAQAEQLNSEVKQSSPQVGYNASPKIVNASPKIVNTSPKIVNASPKIVNASPKVVNGSPKLPNVSPNASPKIVQGSPKVGANVSPKLAPQASPKIIQTSPKLVNQPPPQPSYNQAQFTAAAPYHSQPPSDVGTNQNSAFESTTATMDAQADGQHDFGFDQVNEYPAEAYQPDAGVQPFEQPQYGTGVEYGNENTYEYQTEYTQQEYQGDMGYENQEYTDPQVQSQHPITDYQAQHVDPYNNQPIYTNGDGQLDPNFVNQQVPTDMQQPQIDYHEHTQVDYTESTQVYHNQYQTDPQHQLDDFQSSSEPKYKICNQCGKQYDFDNNFCGRCGCALVEYQPEPQAELHAPLPPTQPVFQPVQAPVDHMLSLDSPSYHAFPNLSVAPVVSYPVSNLQAPVTNHQPVVATNVVDSTPKDPRLRGHCFAIFGFGGKLLVMKPKRQTMYQTNSSGVPTSVEKVYPGMLQVENISQYVYENVIQDAKAPLGVSGPLFTSSKIKKKVLLDQLDEYITKYDHPSTVNHTLIAKYLRLIIETELLVNGKPNPIIQQQVLELLKSNRIEEKTPIDQIRNLLMQGSRESACTVAVNTNLWAEALIIATNISPDMYRDVIMQMMRSGYGSTYNLEQKYPALKVLLASFGGVGHTAVNEFLKPEVLRQDGLWKDCLSLLIANRSMNDGPTLTAFIDQLNQNGFIPAAQLTSFIVDGPGSLSGIENPKSKIVLINGNHIKYPTSFFRNPELIRLTEIVESYLMLKGQWGTSTMPYFQAYKLWYVGYLADLGLVEQSARYIESLTTLGKVFQQPSPYIHKMFGDRLKELSDRLMITCDGAKHISKESSTGSWFGKIGGNLTGAALGQGIQRLMDSAVGLNEPEIASSNGSQSSLFPLPGTESYVKDSSPKSQPSSLSKPVHLNEPYPDYDTHAQQFSGYAGNTNASQQQYNQQPMTYQPQDGNSYDQYQGEAYDQYAPTEQPYQEEQYYNQQTEQYQEQTEQYYEQQNEQQYNNFQPDSNYGYQTDPNYNQQYDQYDQSQQYQDTDNYNTQEITNDYNNEAVDPSQNMNDYNPMQETGHVNQWQPSHVSPPTTSAPPEGNIAAYQPNHISPPPTASVPPIGNVAAYHPNTSLPAEEDLGFGNPPAKKTEVYEDEDLGFGNPKPTQKSAYDQNDDLGLGNSKTSMKPPVPPPTKQENAVPPAKENEKPTTDSKPAPAPAPARSGIFASVLSLFGGKKEDQPVSHKAHLPSGSSFYFDEKTKKWVNKNSNSAEKEEEVQAPPPIMPAGVNNTRPPNAASEPTANVPSNIATLPVAPTPGGDLPPMPMGGSRANKRKGKSRYVDVLNDAGDTNAKASVQAFVPSFSAQNSQVTMMTPMAVPTQPAHNVQPMKPQGVAKPPSPSRIASNMSGFQPPSSPSRVVSSASGFQAPPSPSRIASSASGFQPPPSPTRMVSGTSGVHPPPSPSRLHPNGPGIPVPKPGPPMPSHSNAPIARNINSKGPIPMNPNMMPSMPFNQAKSTASMQSTVSNVGGRAGRPGSNHSSPMIGKRQGRQGAPPPDL